MHSRKIFHSLILVLVATIVFYLDNGDLKSFNVHFNNSLSLEECVKQASSTKSVFASTTRIINVIDGDTVEIINNCKKEHVRLIGINTPETVDPRRSIQCFGKQASDYSKHLLTDKMVSIETDLVTGMRDKYGRLLGYIILEDGTNFNKKIIEEGYAYESTYRSQHYKYQKDFKQAQLEAEKFKRGLWAENTCSGKK